MKILSFDVGIKNLAICLLETNDNNTKKTEKSSTKKQNEINSSVNILDWQLLDLSPTIIHKCVFKKKNKSKKKKASR